jgi:hypothetical protein
VIHPLHHLWFEWHDLPVGRISITEKGVILDALPYNDAAARYDHATRSLVEADLISFDIQGGLSLKDLGDLQIMDLDVVESAPGRITGTLGILCGGAGYWTIQVTNVVWEVEQHGSAAAQFPDYA